MSRIEPLAVSFLDLPWAEPIPRLSQEVSFASAFPQKQAQSGRVVSYLFPSDIMVLCVESTRFELEFRHHYARAGER